jgi:pyruvate dehydrogenase E2 component (dihydrolipoamide acetyltransferase)
MRITVDTEKGLVVPILRNIENKGIAELANEMKALIEKAKANTLTLDDMTGGTFTVTNLGMFGIESFDPIINAPECAILGVGAIQETPSVYQHEICIRKCMKISLVFDHAIVDGATAAKMLKDLKEMLEDPLMMLS